MEPANSATRRNSAVASAAAIVSGERRKLARTSPSRNRATRDGWPAGEAVAVKGGIDAHQDAEDEGEQRGAEGELQRRRHALGEQGRDGLAELVGGAELEAGRGEEIAPELHGNGLVEPELSPEGQPLGRRGIGADHLVHRVAGEAEHGEGDDADGEEDADRLERAADHEGEHGMRVLLPIPVNPRPKRGGPRTPGALTRSGRSRASPAWGPRVALRLPEDDRC